jgi:hypothetical protein
MISASLGVSRRIGKKYRESRMGSALDSHWGWRRSETGSPCKTQERQAIQRFSHAAGREPAAPVLLTDHGAVHDKYDDKLELFKYESLTRNKSANKTNIVVRRAGAVQV